MEATTVGQAFGDERDVQPPEDQFSEDSCPWCGSGFLQENCAGTIVYTCGSLVQYPAKIQDKLCRVYELEHLVARLQEALYPFAEEGAWMAGRRGVGQNRFGIVLADWQRAATMAKGT
jgi:hypothetical protein